MFRNNCFNIQSPNVRLNSDKFDVRFAFDMTYCRCELCPVEKKGFLCSKSCYVTQMGGLIIKVGLFLQKSGIQTGKCGYESAAERITLSNYGILYDSYIKNGRTL